MKRLLLGFALLLLPQLAWAAPDLQVTITAEKVVMIEKDGKQVETLVAATETLPGDTLVYTLSYKNLGDEAASDVVLNDPIPESTTYVVDSVFGKGSDISFSVDHGKTFKQPSMLTYTIKSSDKEIERKATPDDYTDIRWVIHSIKAGSQGNVGFRVQIK